MSIRSSGPARRRRQRAARRGAALLIVVILCVVMIGYAATLMATARVNANDALSSVRNEQGVEIASAGAMAAIAEIASYRDAAGDGWGWLSAPYAGGTYTARTAALGNGEYRIVATGTTSDGTVRCVEMIIRPGPILPASDAAIGMYGNQIDKKDKAKLEIHPHDGFGKEDGANPDGGVRISGIDPNGAAPVPAVGIEDPDAYVQVMEKLSKKIAEGKVPASTFEGSPMVPFTNSKGQTVTVPIVETPNPRLNSDTLEDVRAQIYSAVRNQIVPAASLVVDNHIDGGTYTWGTPAAPAIVVVDGKDIHVDGNAVINGAGILVVTKDWHLHHATINWQGTIVVLGDAKHQDSKIQNHHAALNVTGNILAIAGDTGSARIDFHNDDKKRDGGTRITGTVMALAGSEKNEKAELRFHHGDVTIDGFAAVLGTKAKFKIDEHGDHKGLRSFTLNGSMVAAVPNRDDKHKEKLEVKIHGDATIQYDKNKMEAALRGLGQFANTLNIPPQYYALASWRQMPEALAVQAQAGMQRPPIPVFGQSHFIAGSPQILSVPAQPAGGGAGAPAPKGGGAGAGGGGAKAGGS